MKKSYKHGIFVSLVVPVYGGGQTVINQINSCEMILKKIAEDFEIIIADDKSPDNTARLIKENFSGRKHYKLVFNNKNLGIAKNIKKLYLLARFNYVCLFSADGGWDPDDVRKMIINASKTNSGIVIGKRNRKNYPIYRKIVSFLYNLLPLLLFGVNTKDAGSIKIFEKKIIQENPIISNSVSFEAELIIRASKKGAKISYVPVSFKRNSSETSSSGKISSQPPPLSTS